MNSLQYAESEMPDEQTGQTISKGEQSTGDGVHILATVFCYRFRDFTTLDRKENTDI